MPVVALDSGSGTECTVETLESCNDQWLADLYTDCSSIFIVYLFYLYWNPVGHITWSPHLFSNTAICPFINPLNPELNPICYLLALLGAHHFLHISRIRIKLLTFRLLMSYIYGAPILDVSRSHTTTQHSR